MRSSEANVLQEFCKERKRWKSDGARSGLYGGCGNTSQQKLLQQFLPSDQTCVWSRTVVVKLHTLTID